MPTADAVLVRTLSTDLATRHNAMTFLALTSSRTSGWDVLPGSLGAELDRFERLQIVVANARITGARPEVVEPVQAALVRRMVEQALLHSEPLKPGLSAVLAKRDPRPLFHTVLRQLGLHTSDTETLFAASSLCRLAAFDLEDGLRAVSREGGEARDLVAVHEAGRGRVQSVEVDPLPFGAVGLALLWTTAMIGLGDLSDDSDTTEHYTS